MTLTSALKPDIQAVVTRLQSKEIQNGMIVWFLDSAWIANGKVGPICQAGITPNKIAFTWTTDKPMSIQVVHAVIRGVAYFTKGYKNENAAEI